jgi:hypothetical protein
MKGSAVWVESAWRPWVAPIAALAALLLLGLFGPISAASAGLLKEATDRVESTVDSVGGAADALPPPPTAPPPPPATPRLPPEPSVKAPPPAKPPPPSRPDPALEAPSSDRATAAAGSPPAAPTGLGREAPDRAAPTQGKGGGSGTPSADAPAGAGGPDPGGAGRATRAPLSVGPADAAAVRRWIARVWPGVPLGGGTGRASISEAIGADLLRPAVAAATRSLHAVSAVARAVGFGDAQPADSPAGPSARHGFLSNVASPAPWEDVPYFVAIGALLALLAFTVWREFRSVLHPRLH